ncbi:hypothetical protein QOZ80_2AG0107420 [Eleusine coracana subsp. coracana]|nr:hypothetical protein QOZ80_2AG0107420 [Eleusine coracana subsp. coracana]
MAASVLRLHFQDCFVQGCDGSILLDDVDGTFTGEKTADMNINSVRGFEVIYQIKANVEALCPGVVSCADILALAARDFTVAGGRLSPARLSREANTDLPSPSTSNLNELIAAFTKKGPPPPREMVALSGAHTIDPTYGETLQSRCSRTSGDDNLTPLDVTSPDSFDGSYFRDLFRQKGLFHSDQALFDRGSTSVFVSVYASSEVLFRSDFANAMVKMSELNPLTGSDGQVRTNCRPFL